MTLEQQLTFIHILRQKLDANPAYILDLCDTKADGVVTSWFEELGIDRFDDELSSYYLGRRLARNVADAATKAGFEITLHNFKAAFNNDFQSFRELIADYIPDYTSSSDCSYISKLRP